MKFTERKRIKERVSFLFLLRLIFVLFSMYLLRNAFYRWDGFEFYAPFSEFIPAVALVLILWSIVAFIVTVLAWLMFRAIEDFFEWTGLGIKTEHLLFYSVVSVLLGLLVWKIKRLFWTDVQTSRELKAVVFVCVILVSTYPVWKFCGRIRGWFRVLQERITPLVWLFGLLVAISVPIVGLYAITKQSHKPIPQEFSQSTLSESGEKHPNILLVIFDTLTARDISLYGYQRKTTPFIDKWAMNATVFKRVEAESNHTTPATSSIMTGKRVWTHQVYQQAGSIPIKSNVESLPGELKKHGYYNVSFVVNPFASAKKLGMLDSFDIASLPTEFYKLHDIISFDGYQWGHFEALLYRLFGDKVRIHDWIMDSRLLGRLQPLLNPKFKVMNPEYTETIMPPEIAFNKFLNIVDNLPRPFFAWVHLYPPHAYYLPPAPYRGLFGPYIPPERYMDFATDIDSDDMRELRILYDEFIRYCDKQYEEFIRQLEGKGATRNTIIVFTSDHGESFEHNSYGHGNRDLYEQVTHIPLIIKEPAQKQGQIIDALVEQVDIPATILELVGIPVPGWMEGRSLVPIMHGENLPAKPVFSMYLRNNRSRGHQISKGTIAVWEGNYKLIHYLEENKSLLFDLRNDPDELNNLFDKESEIAKHLLGLIKTNLAKANERIMLLQKEYK